MFVPSLVTEKVTSSVGPPKSGVDKSVKVAIVVFHTTITVPALESSAVL
jgi:hypothetical protein